MRFRWFEKYVKYGEPILEQAAEPVTEFDTPELRQRLITDMWETMYAAKGVGLAAPQIGVAKRISVIDISVGEDERRKARASSTRKSLRRKDRKPEKKAA